MRRSQTDGRCVFFRVRRKSRARYAAFRRALHFSNSSNAGSRGASLFMNCGDLGGSTDGTTRRPSTWVLLAETRVISYSSIINKCRPRTFPGRRLNSTHDANTVVGPGKTVNSKHATVLHNSVFRSDLRKLVLALLRPIVWKITRSTSTSNCCKFTSALS